MALFVSRIYRWNIEYKDNYGGDPENIVIAGQSAGAHLGACLVLAKSKMEAPKQQTEDPTSSQDARSTDQSTSRTPNEKTPTTTTWHALHIRGFIGVSGPYDLVAMKNILHNNGLDKSIVSKMFCDDVAKYSPTLSVEDLAAQNDEVLTRVREHFPATCIIHGDSDKTVPFRISLDFFENLKALKLDEAVEFRLYPSWSHTDPILEAPFAGNHLLHKDIYDLVKRWAVMKPATPPTTIATPKTQDQEPFLLPPFDETHSACTQICPLFLVETARFCNPF